MNVDRPADLRLADTCYETSNLCVNCGEQVGMHYQHANGTLSCVRKEQPEPSPSKVPCTRPWEYCPECGSEEIHYEDGAHKQCAECYQEWFTDVDYTDVVRQHLAARAVRKKQRAVESAAPLSSNEWGGVETLLRQRNDALAEVERLRAALQRLRRWAVLNIAVTPPNQADLPEWRETIKEVEASLSSSPSETPVKHEDWCDQKCDCGAAKAADSGDCDTCGGSGEVDEMLGGIARSNPHAPCPDCRPPLKATEQCNHDLQSPAKTLKATLAPNYGWRCTVCHAEWYPEKTGARNAKGELREDWPLDASGFPDPRNEP